jgi:hypothetical protein
MTSEQQHFEMLLCHGFRFVTVRRFHQDLHGRRQKGCVGRERLDSDWRPSSACRGRQDETVREFSIEFFDYADNFMDT